MKRSKDWLSRQKKDPYVKNARRDTYRSRAAYKLEEIDRKDRLFKPGMTVVDLGAAPGSWAQYASERILPEGKLIAVDILEMEALPKVNVIQGDFTDPHIYDMCLGLTGKHSVDLVISDMAPNLTGIRDVDQAKSMHLAGLALEFASAVLKPGGNFLIKLFQGQGVDRYRNELSMNFQRVMVRKPGASRRDSREFYILARGYEI